MLSSTRPIALRRKILSRRIAASVALLALLPACGTPLVRSIRERDTGTFRTIVDQGTQLETPYKGMTPLMWAATEGTPDMITLLLDHHASVDVLDRSGYSALFWALESGNREGAEILVRRGANVNLANRRGITPLLAATDSDDIALVRLMLEKGAGTEKTDSEGLSPLLLATRAANVEMTDLLIAKGADINRQDHEGNTPLIMAAGANSLELVKVLVEKGVDLNKGDKRGNTPLAMAVGGGNAEMTRYLIAKHADVRARDQYGMTMLMTALKYDRRDVAAVLLEGPCEDINAADKRGNTALFFAIRPNFDRPSMLENTELIGLILKRGAAVNHRNDTGATPLMIAALYGAVSTVDLLLKNGANPGLKNNRDETAVSHADENNNYYSSESRDYLPDNSFFWGVRSRCTSNYGAVSRLLDPTWTRPLRPRLER